VPEIMMTPIKNQRKSPCKLKKKDENKNKMIVILARQHPG
jgi:hypothetical protein